MLMPFDPDRDLYRCTDAQCAQTSTRTILVIATIMAVAAILWLTARLVSAWYRTRDYRVEDADHSGHPVLGLREPYHPADVLHGVTVFQYFRQRLGHPSAHTQLSSCGHRVPQQLTRQANTPLCPLCVRHNALFPVNEDAARSVQ